MLKVMKILPVAQQSTVDIATAAETNNIYKKMSTLFNIGYGYGYINYSFNSPKNGYRI
jgi:hypothetical protein